MELCDAVVTLDGQPAKITGYNKPFATVSYKSNGLGCEWSWITVLHIVTNKNGEFKS